MFLCLCPLIAPPPENGENMDRNSGNIRGIYSATNNIILQTDCFVNSFFDFIEKECSVTMDVRPKAKKGIEKVIMLRKAAKRKRRKKGISRSAERDKGYAPLTAPPPQKGGRKLSPIWGCKVVAMSYRKTSREVSQEVSPILRYSHGVIPVISRK